MARRREPADAFGASLLDVLSNLFGALILLMLIIAVLIRNDIFRLNRPDEGSLGNFHSTNFKKPERAKDKLNFLVAQIQLEGSGELQYDGPQSIAKSIKLGQGAASDVENYWSIVRQGQIAGTWSIVPKGNDQGIERVCITVKVDGLSVCSISQAYVTGSQAVLKITEREVGGPVIFVGGKPCNVSNSKKNPCL